MKLNWFNTKTSDAFAKELALFIVADLNRLSGAKAHKFSGKADKTLNKAAERLADFKKEHPLNFYSRSKFANAFLWALKDSGCSPEYANQLTDWLTLRL